MKIFSFHWGKPLGKGSVYEFLLLLSMPIGVDNLRVYHCPGSFL